MAAAATALAAYSYMVIVLILLSLAIYVPGLDATKIRLYNACPFTIWPAWLPNSGIPQLGPGGTKLNPWQSFDVYASTSWAGRFWGRTGCEFNITTGYGNCKTGDCSGEFGCKAAGEPPATLAEFTSLHKNNLDNYDVSVVDGYNLPIRVSTSDSRCGTAGCNRDANVNCPSELALRDKEGYVVACKSACLAFKKDYLCCTNEYNSPERCHPNAYSDKFKESCPNAYTYAYDKENTAFTCPSGTDYTITFCPSGGSSSLLALKIYPEES